MYYQQYFLHLEVSYFLLISKLPSFIVQTRSRMNYYVGLFFVWRKFGIIFKLPFCLYEVINWTAK